MNVLHVYLAVFSLLGYSGYRRHQSIFGDNDTVTVDLNPGSIMYELLPEAFSRIPKESGGVSFAFIFFLMIFLNTLDNVALMIDMLTTSITEIFPNFFLRFNRARSVLLFLITLLCFVMSIIFTTPGGLQLMTIFSNAFGGGTNYLVVIFLTVFAATSVFGEEGTQSY